MTPLPLTPLPCEISEMSHSFRRIESEGFVDEQVVAMIIARGAHDRAYREREGMALSSSGEDYAGWALPV